MASRFAPPLLVALLLLAAPAGRVAWSAGEPDPEWEALEAIVKADFVSASEIYVEFLEKDPDGPRADYWFFRALETAGRAGKRGAPLLARALEAAYGSRNPAAASHAAWFRACALLKKGETREAEAVARNLGFLRDWAVIGPFENEGEAGFKDVFGPEKDLAGRTGFMDFAAPHKGKQGDNRWRVPGLASPLFLTDLGSLFRLSENVCAYACTHVRVREPGEVCIRLGCEGAVKLWVNGRLVHAGDRYRKFFLDQDVAGARLETGWNEILVKVCQKKGPWTLLLRLTAPDGSAVEGIEAAPDPIAVDPGAKRARAGEGPSPLIPRGDSLGRLDSLCGKETATPLDLARFAYLLSTLRVLDENDTRARDVLLASVEKAPESAVLRIMLSSAELDRNRALEQARKARFLAPGAAGPAFLLSRFYGAPRPIGWSAWPFWSLGEDAAHTQEEYAGIREVEMPDKERALLEEALGGVPDFLDARLAMAAHFFRKAGGNPQRIEPVGLGRPFALQARKSIEKALSLAGPDPLLLRMLDALALSGPKRRADRARERLKSDATDVEARRELVQALLDTGRLEEAVGVLGDRVRLNPFDRGAWAEMARAYRAFDVLDRAAACLEMALAVCPEDTDALQDLGDLHLASGDREKALAAFCRALEVKPQLSELGKRLRRLEKKGEDDFYKPFRVDTAPLVKAALAGSDTDKADAVIFLKNDVIRILENGMAKHYHQRVIKVLTEKGVNAFRWLSAWPGRYDYYSRTRGEVKEAKLYRADGTVLDGYYRDGGSNARFETLRKGDVIVFEVKTDELGEPRYKGYFGLMLLMQDGTDPCRESRVTFLHPEDKPTHFRAIRVPDPPRKEKSGDLTAHTWCVKDLPQIKEEFNMPGLFELCPCLHASTFQTWDEVSKWYSNLIKDQFESSEEIRQAVRKITEGLETAEEKVDALFRFMVSDIRYESIDLSDHSYRPFKARQTFDRKYGDCKDTATLFSTMLREAGIESHVVLIRAGRSERIDIELPSMKIFNHAIAFVPSIGPDGLLLDGTARYCGSRELPEMDQGAVAFIVGLEGKGKAIYTPFDKPEANLNRTRFTVQLASDGSATLRAETLIRGQEAYEYRREFQQGTKRKEEMEKRLNAHFKGASVDSVAFSDLADYNRPVEVETGFRLPSLARQQDRHRALRPVLVAAKLCDNFAQTDTRYHDLITGYPHRNERTVEILLPEGWKVKKLPSELDLANAWGAYSLRFETAPGKVTAKVSFELRAPRVPRDRYAEFRAFCEEVDRAEDEELILERKGE